LSGTQKPRENDDGEPLLEMRAAIEECEALFKEFRKNRDLGLQWLILTNKCIEKYASQKEKETLMKLYEKRQDETNKEKIEKLTDEFITNFEYVAKSVSSRFNEEYMSNVRGWPVQEVPDQKEFEKDFQEAEKQLEKAKLKAEKSGKDFSEEDVYKFFDRFKRTKKYKGIEDAVDAYKVVDKQIKAKMASDNAKMAPIPAAKKLLGKHPKLISLKEGIPPYDDTESWLEYLLDPSKRIDPEYLRGQKELYEQTGWGPMRYIEFQQAESEKTKPLLKAYNLAVFHLINGDLHECRELALKIKEVASKTQTATGHRYFILKMAGNEAAAASVLEQHRLVIGDRFYVDRPNLFDFIIAIRDGKFMDIVNFWNQGTHGEGEGRQYSLDGPYFPRRDYFKDDLLHLLDFSKAIVRQDDKQARDIVFRFRENLDRKDLKSFFEGNLSVLKVSDWKRLRIFHYIELVEALFKRHAAGSLFSDYLEWKKAMAWT
jgi:hypothetical protein